MTDAPERIWATEDKENFGEDRFHSTRPMRGLTEYVRADLYAALEAEIARLTAAIASAEAYAAADRKIAQKTAADAVVWKARAEKAEAERDAAMAGAVKVKPLVWVRDDVDDFSSRDADTRITTNGTGWGLSPRDWPHFGDYPHVSLDAAKAAAQADYEARIRAALQPDPDARQADLAKAWMMGRDAAAAWHTMQAETAMGALCCGSDNYEIRRAGRISDAHREQSDAIRALTPPADMAAKIGGE